MYVLYRDRWNDSYVPYFRHPRQVRVKVRAWFRCYSISDAYYAYSRSLRRVRDYIRKVGVISTARKVMSRLRETQRDQKFVACGWGEIHSAPEDSPFQVGDPVAFIAPLHPACVSEVCLDARWVHPLQERPEQFDACDSVITGVLDDDFPWESVAGWSDWSERDVDVDFLERAHQHIERHILTGQQTIGDRRVLDVASPSTSGRDRRQPPGNSKPRAVIFGMGQYAKVIITPRIHENLQIACWHELDPTQIGDVNRYPFEVRTSAYPEPDEKYDAYFIAGYHHTHADIAVHALAQGAFAVVEKPVATTPEQLDAVLNAVSRHGRKLFVGYHKRYSPFNDYLRQDLEIRDEVPVFMHAIAYEVALPRNHWYLWPSSRGKIICNGCHWIDYFLFLNDFSDVVSVHARTLSGGDHVVDIELENGAAMNLVVTDHGSARLGTRDIMHITAKGRTAVIRNDSMYEAESGARLLRRRKIKPDVTFNRMYRVVSRSVVLRRDGDTVDSIQISAGAVLEAQAQINNLG